MTDSLALNGMGGYGYYDPYFMQAYQAYNLNQAQAMQAAEAQRAAAQAMQAAEAQRAAAQAAQTQAATQTATVPMTTQQPEEKKKSNAGLVIGGLATVGASVLLYKAHKKGGDKGIKEGFKMMWDGITNKVTKAATTQTERFTCRQTKNGDWFAQVPNRRQRINVDDTDKLSKLGVSREIPKINDKGVKIIDFTFKKDGNTFHVRNGKVVKYVNKNEENLLSKMTSPATNQDNEYKKVIYEFIEKVQRGDEAAIKELTRLNYTHTADGVTRRFSINEGTTTMNKVVTNRFDLGSDAVTAYRSKNPQANKAVKAIKEGKTPEGLKAVAGEYNVDGTVFKIENDKIVGMTQGDKYYPAESDRFRAWKKKKKKAFNEMLENIK